MRIRWTTPAVDDLTVISDYVCEQDGKAAARRVALAVYDRVNALRRFPRRGRIGRVAGTRELVIAGFPYLIIYRISEVSVEINRILHGAQKWP